MVATVLISISMKKDPSSVTGIYVYPDTIVSFVLYFM